MKISYYLMKISWDLKFISKVLYPVDTVFVLGLFPEVHKHETKQSSLFSHSALEHIILFDQ